MKLDDKYLIRENNIKFFVQFVENPDPIYYSDCMFIYGRNKLQIKFEDDDIIIEYDDYNFKYFRCPYKALEFVSKLCTIPMKEKFVLRKYKLLNILNGI